MEENQNTAAVPSPNTNPVIQPVVVPESAPITSTPTGAAALQPDPSLQTATINVSPVVRAGSAVPTYPEPLTPLPPVEKEWTPANQSIVSDPHLVLGLSLLSVVAVILFLTFGISVNIWIKVILLLVLSLTGLVMAVRAYAANHAVTILLSVIISTMMVVGTVVVGTTYIYYYIKIKQVTSAVQNSY